MTTVREINLYDANELLAVLEQLCHIRGHQSNNSGDINALIGFCLDVIGAKSCALFLLDTESESLVLKACSGFEGNLSNYTVCKQISNKESTLNSRLDFSLFGAGEAIERFQLSSNYDGVATDRILELYRLNQLNYAYFVPLKHNGELFGYLALFKTNPFGFESFEKRVIALIAKQITNQIARNRSEHMFRATTRLINRLFRNLQDGGSDDLFSQVAESASDIFKATACLIWLRDSSTQRFVVRASFPNHISAESLDSAKIDQGYAKSNKKITYLADIHQANGKFHHHELARANRWVSMLRAQMVIGDITEGIIELYTQLPKVYSEEEKELLLAIVNHITISVYSKKANNHLQRYSTLSRMMQMMTRAHTTNELLDVITDNIGQLIDYDSGWISKYDLTKGKLTILSPENDPLKGFSHSIDEGITGKALKDRRPIMVNDVRQVKENYLEYKASTKSELCIPIIVEEARVLVGSKQDYRPRPIGVINLESNKRDAFGEEDVFFGQILASNAAIRFERLETIEKDKNCSKVEQKLVGKQDWDEIFRIMVDTITDTLGFQFVNISLANTDTEQIVTCYTSGYSPENAAYLQKNAAHSLHSNDIQSWVYKHREILVIDGYDERFDKKIYRRLNHDQFIRVFMPLVLPSQNKVIGTLEAGYFNHYRKNIYVRELQTLNRFIGYATAALERGWKGHLESLSHELRAPAVGIRNNAAFLQRHWNTINDEKRSRKFGDILLDSELLLGQIGKFEHLLGGGPQETCIRRTLIFRDIIIKTIHQLNMLIMDFGFNPANVEINPQDFHVIEPLYLDQTRLNQVVYNLLINSIKYAKPDRDKFHIKIEAHRLPDYYAIAFKDWGIGINEEYRAKIFQQGFRTPEAIRCNVTGSGLGLNIASKLMLEMKGDLVLANLRNPTEFIISLPTHLRREQHDRIH